MSDVELTGRAAEPEGATRRRADALRNDDLITSAAVSVISSRGWDVATVEGIADVAGLTYGAIYGRFANKADLGLALWESAVGRDFVRQLAELAENLATTSDKVVAQLTEFARPTPAQSCGLELILASFFDSELETIREEISEVIDTKIDTARDSGGRAHAAATAASMGLALGLMMVHTRPWVANLDLSDALRRRTNSLMNPTTARDIPASRADYLHFDPFNTGDNRLDAVFSATAWEVGERGFVRATISRICRRAGVSSGFVYGRFPGKFELVLAVFRAQLAFGFDSLNNFMGELTAKFGAVVTEAVAWREYMEPNLERKRNFTIELNRLATHDTSVRTTLIEEEQRVLNDLVARSGVPVGDFVSGFHLDVAMGFGICLLPNLVPSVWDLPYVCVTSGFVTE